MAHLSLVTGGAGFIGSHIVDELIAKGNNVRVVDLVEVPNERKNAKAEYIIGDILNLPKMIEVSKGCDSIFHIAAEANINHFFTDPVKSTTTNTIGTLNICEAARLNKVKRVLLASTEWVYGASELDIVDEDTKIGPPMPDHIYTSSKIAAELFLMNYHKLYGVPYTIIRYGIPFGERARPQTVTPIFISKILNGETIEINGNGEQFRQFIYVKDLAQGNVACLHPSAENQIININGTEKITVKDIIANLEQISGRKASYRLSDDRPGQYTGKFVRIEKAKRLLGWEPQYSYRMALTDYYNYFVENDFLKK